MSSRKTSKPLAKFNIGEDYQLLRVLGEGAYGTVVAALHKPTERQVAIKRMLPFDHSLFSLRALRELKLLKFFSTSCLNENIVSCLATIRPESLDAFREIYLVQELMQTDLHRETQSLTDDHCQYIIYQALRGLKTIHSADIIHRDLKPANLLLNDSCELKVCDFGLARSVTTTVDSRGGKLMTEYVATRWYRAPEIMLSNKRYTKAVDIWAIGCILAELLNRLPLFPGRDYSHQLDLILDVLGTPTSSELNAIPSRRSREYIISLPISKRRPFPTLFPQASQEAIDFLARTLTFDPKNRMNVEEALCHPYLASYHDPEDEPVVAPISPSYFEFDLHKKELTKDQLKMLLYDEVVSFESTI
ncbi:kinase-like protein [Dendrothele bispora CBS 962.96]|uniref:Mitogen-activated protein kinase n=1 Tax=Dendrothele bispora (strain CBS 962.96) TaxID=1314807 RepID=A0A4S8KMB8_DENBC|nr:kinase-like protein [Dendrothele bispora CBS 962.96]